MKRISLLVLTSLLFGAWVFAQEDGGDVINPPPRGKPARIRVITDPPNSEVYLGGVFLGKTPINDMAVKSGRQTLIIVDQGYELVNVRFNVWPDSLNQYEAKTVIPKGNIEVTTNPKKCYITVDGDSADFTDGSSLLIKNLDAGDHVVGAKCGSRTKEVLVQVKGEETVPVNIDVTKK
ncbi:MAG TPA: PEGA domain-containing protein [Fibrobacteraceae bacterium]|nr:PEGA domain-containing protein [Fibrobacteraceae bacterium]